MPRHWADMSLLQELIVEVRGLAQGDWRRREGGRADRSARSTQISRLRSATICAIVEKLARVSEVRFVDQISAGLAKHSTSHFDVAVIYERKIDVAAEREKMNKEITKQEKIIASSDRQLNNPGFTAKAPAHIVEGLKKQRDDAQQLLDKLRRDLDSLPPRERSQTNGLRLQSLPRTFQSPWRRGAADLEVRDLHKAYRAAAKRWHPDRFENNQRERFEAEERFKRINAAYMALCEHFENPTTTLAQQNSSRRSESILRPSISFGDAPGCFVAPALHCAGSRSYQRSTG